MQEQNCQELFTLTIEQFAQVIELGIPLEALFVLECLIQGTNPAKHIKASRLAGINQTLSRKGYLSKEGVTPLGKKTYESLLCGGMGIKEVVQDMKVESKSFFEQWWEVFPPHDGFQYGPTEYQKTRSLRTKKESCLLLFTKAVAEGHHTAEGIIQGTKNHIWQMKVQSGKERKNKLTFLHNSETYLRNKDYEIWIIATATEIQEPTNTEIYL